jgi:hypothetical protein
MLALFRRPAAGLAGSALSILTATAAVSATAPLVQETIVCTDPDNVDVANMPAVARSEVVLRALGCRPSARISDRKWPDGINSNGPLPSFVLPINLKPAAR